MTVCNAAVFIYQGAEEYLYAVIGLGCLVGLYMMVRMCRLCSSAFSYTHFHIHEAYKFYALALMALAFTVFFHKTQLDYIKDNSNPERQDEVLTRGE